MKVTDRKMDRKWETAIAALLTAQTVAEAAKACGLGETTLYRWLVDGDFQTRFREAKRAALDQAIAHLHGIATEAVATLRAVMTDDSAPANARVTAARTVLEMAVKSAELDELTVRVAELEAAINPHPKGRAVR